MSQPELLLEVAGLRVESRTNGVKRTIVSALDLTVGAGETVGIVGESGSGKSLTARAVTGLLPGNVHASGSVRLRGAELLGASERRLSRIRGRQLSMLFQDPYTLLNPLVRVGRQITETARDEAGVRLKGSAADADAVRRLAEVGLDGEVRGRYPFELSGGMRQRIGIAAALASDPELLIADEPTTALDVTTQKEILELLRSLQQRRQMGLVLITHDLRVAFSMCDRIYVLYAGRVLESGPGEAIEHEPLHPYSLALLLAEPPLEHRAAALATVAGNVPPPDEVANECAFATRCQWATDICRREAPPLQLVDGRLTACVRIGEIRGELQAAREAGLNSVAAPPVLPTEPEALLEITDLRKRYGLTDALRGVSLQVGRGESVGLVGESGSGKTTLARCLLGLVAPTSGQIVVDGIQAHLQSAFRADERRRYRSTVQMVFQDPYSSLNPARTVGATLREILAMIGEDSAKAVTELLARVGLPAAYAERKPAALSGGERQRVAIARAIAVRPKLIVCDEPVSALDVTVQAQILDLFRELREELGVSYLFITHDLAVVRQLVERIYVLYRGEVVEHGSVDTVLDQPSAPYTRELIASVPRTTPDWLNA